MALNKLVDNTFKSLLRQYGEGVLATEVPEEHRTVLLVYHANGIIGNGGFHYLFEHNVPGDPGFILTRQAHKVIGAERACEAFERAFAVFPNGIAPADVNTRLEFWAENYALMDAFYDNQSPDAIYLSALDETVQLLERYIKGHPAAFKSSS